jgi:hypothetical protein
VLDEIRATCAAVAAQSTQVRIDEERLASYAVDDAIADDDPGRMRLDSVADTVAFVVALDAINFGSGWFPVLRKRPGMSGYHTIASMFRELGAPTAEWLAHVTSGECCALFDQDRTSEAMELMTLFADAWNQLGSLLLSRYDGEAVNLVEAAHHSADVLLDLLRVAPYFEDRRAYRGIDVAFYKRAQIVSADLHLALAARIDAGELLDEGSEAEVELRACAVHAVELLAARTGTTPATLDNVLWNRGQGPTYKAIPRPRCRTVSY